MPVFVRSFTAVSAVAILAATAHVNITAHGGYGTAFSFLAGAVALGVVAASLAIGQLAAEKRPLWVALFIAFIAIGEASAFLNTAERVVIDREEKQAPLRAQQEAREKALKRVEAAERALAAIPSTTERIRKAEEAKAAADAAVITKSSERGCASNCRQLLQAQVDAAAAEINAARDELRLRRQAAELRLTEARDALAGIKVMASASPLADHLGLEPWQLDVLSAALLSTSANGFACILLVFGTHGSSRKMEVATKEHVESVPLQVEPETSRVESAPNSQRTPVRRLETPRDQAARFGVECLQPGGEAELIAIQRHYRQWCESRGITAMPAKLIGQALADLFEETGIEIVDRDGRLVALGVSISEPRRKALGHMASLGEQRKAS